MNAVDLVVAAATPFPNDATRSRIAALAAQVTDWDAVLDLAAACRALPILHDRLAASDSDIRLPQPVQDRLEQAHLANTLRSVALARQLVIVMDALNAANIPALTLKGPTLAQLAYDTPSLRQYDDIDIIVPKRDLRKAKATIEARGYVEVLGLPRTIEQSPFRPDKPYTLRHRDGSHDIDLATSLLHDYFSFRLPTRALWDQPHRVNLDGHPVRTIPTELHVLYLCVHGAKHLWSRPVWVADLAGLLARWGERMDWDRVWALARKGDAERMVRLGVQLAVERYAPTLPTGLTTRLDRKTDAAVEEVADVIRQRLVTRTGAPETDDLERLRIHLRLRTRLRTRLRYLLVRGLMPSYNDWRAVALPGVLFPLYVLVRPLRLIGRGVATLLRRRS